MQKKINPDNDVFDPDEDYFKMKDKSDESEKVEYFPNEDSKPPHY